ncbi:DEDD exonuclease domain-containing protein [Cryptosporangium arvum]|uniref:Exonuclease, DNA polymerase III, epsilon subunit family n=1 Tax=Cryptosporangium arvum DSM 44712 TaxID=927661 RepID=A0A010ZQC4_9ACTN|nr:DEDD exonuclease domain-containing protein [Cryptosporangium arvum]EXG80874.1 exonuclease, DNA polymerase III, epsilon subunit family [Cryptosporangium arvum DSM 44712]
MQQHGSSTTTPKGWVQSTFDELGQPLRDTTFVVVDLETTGGAPGGSAITEIGAVKVRGGEVLGEFQTLVDPGIGIPPFITVLTGITDAMVAAAPPIPEVLPAFLEFARGTVLVAHNAPFDLSHLKAACEAHGMVWPGFRKVDTAVLARRALSRDEVRNCKLSTLAAFFRSPTTPVHRALADAQATVHVLHSLMERLGNLGIQTLEELETFTTQVSEAQRRKRHLAVGVPNAPGVYLFRDARDRPLYVGTSKDLRSRVRQYFVSSEQRSRMAEMINAAERIEAIVCAHSLEAEVRELRLIAAHKPPYNRRSKHPERRLWLRLTTDAYPRLSVVRQARDDGTAYLGPFSSRRSAEAAATAVYDVLPLRQCGGVLSTRKTSPACALAEIRKCEAPCEHRVSVEAYGRHAAAFREAVQGDPSRLVERLLSRIESLADRQRYEEAAVARNRLSALLRAVIRSQRTRAISVVPELVAARADGAGGWEISVVRHGRLAAAGVAARGVPPMPVVDQLVAAAETVERDPASEGLHLEEIERVLAWVERPETRLVKVDTVWSSPARGAGRWAQLVGRMEAGRHGADPFGDRRRLRPESRPAVPVTLAAPGSSNLSTHGAREPESIPHGPGGGTPHGDRGVPAPPAASAPQRGPAGDTELHPRLGGAPPRP